MSKSLPSTVIPNGEIPLHLPPDPDRPRFAPPAVSGELGRLGPYRVQKLLGKGGMGAVYLALDAELQRQVALKVILPRYAADPDAADRFRREARAAAAVRHDNVVTVYQVGEERGTLFLAMEFLFGYPLDRYLSRKGRLTVPQALRVGAETAGGLAAAHALNLIHRDIKPANLWLEAPQGRIKILDFGLAKPLNETRGGTELTGSGAVMGTPAYMSPEQARGQKIDGRSDLFSLGVVLYELVAGVRPFDGSNPTAVGIAIATEEPAPVRERNPDVPEPVARAIHRLLAKDPAARPQTAAEVARMLRELERDGSSPAVDLSQTPSKPAAPQVVYVPIQVTAYEPGASAFEHLEGSDDRTAPVAAARTLMRARPGAKFPLKAVALAVLLAGATVGAVVYAARKPAAPTPGGNPVADPPPPAPLRQDRELALWVFQNKGSVLLDGGKEARSEDDLPPRPYAVTGVVLSDPNFRLTDADVKRFESAPKLTSIECYSTRLTADGLKALAALPQAERFTKLSLPSPEAPSGFDALGKCKSLQSLAFRSTDLRGQTGFLAKLPALRGFYAPDCRLTDDDLAPLRTVRLTDLQIQQNPKVTAAGLRHLAAADLATLYLTDTGVTGDAAEQIAAFTQLEVLSLPRRAGWGDREVARLATLTALQLLQLEDNPVGDAGLRPVVRAAPALGLLRVNGTAVTDALLDALHGRERLGGVHAANTKVTPAGAKRLLAASPNCRAFVTQDPDADPDRALLAWVRSKGGAVEFHGGEKPPQPGGPKPLPQTPQEVVCVHRIRTHGAHKMTDADVGRFAGCAALTAVEADGDTDLTDAGFEKLAALPQAARVTSIWLASPRVTAAGVAHLTPAKFTALAALSLRSMPAALPALKSVAALPALVEVHLGGSGATDADIAALVGASGLKNLFADGTGLTDASLVALAGFEKLIKLDLTGVKVTTPAVKALMAERPTCDVKFDYDPKADPDRALAAWCFARGAGVRLRDGKAVRTAADLPDGVIEVVAAGGRDGKGAPTDADIDLLAAAHSLTKFDWDTTAFTDAGLEKWSRAPNAPRMVELHVNSKAVTDGGTVHLARFRSLTWLNLCGADVHAAGLRRLAALPRLDHLNLNGSNVRDDDLRELAGFKVLTRLTLGGTPVTNASVAHLAVCRGLKMIDLRGQVGVTAAAVEALRRALPDCSVYEPGHK